MKIEEILKMNDVESIHDYVRLLLVENTKLTNISFSIFNYISRDKTRHNMSGVYYEDGFSVATDGFILVGTKSIYPQELEGKIINNLGATLYYNFPNYKRVLPKDSDCNSDTEVNLPIEDITTQYKKYKVAKKEHKNIVNNPHYKFKIGDYYFNIAMLYEKVLPAQKVIQGKAYTAKDKLYLKNDKGEFILLMKIVSLS